MVAFPSQFSDISENCLRVFIVNGLALHQLLVKERQRHLAGADHGADFFELGHLSRVGRLVPQHPYMVGQGPP